MKSKHTSAPRSPTRRAFLRELGALGAAGALASALPPTLGGSPRARAAASSRKFLFVITATGGASIIDSFLPVLSSDVSSATLAEALTVYPERALAEPRGSNLRCVRNLQLGGLFRNDYDPADFLRAHMNDMAVVAVEGTSVNHVVAQKRAITGADIDRGRTIMEAAALRHGDGLALPNVNLSGGGYLEPGLDDVPTSVRAEIVARPDLFANATHGSRGVPRAPEAAVVERARTLREKLEGLSPLDRRPSALRSRYLSLRTELGPRLEQADLITKLMMLTASEESPLGDFGLTSSPDAAALLETFPNLAVDKLQTQAALAFLLVKHGVSCAVTFGPSAVPTFLPGGAILDTPIAFDYSHNDHVTAQNVMWSRITQVADGLIRLLKSEELGDGRSLWDQSLIYVATDFGRTKERPAGSSQFGSSHHMNNGNLLVSPLLRGNRVYGGVDPDTCLTYGCDLREGSPRPGTSLREGHVYSLLAQALDIDFPGRHDMSLLLR